MHDEIPSTPRAEQTVTVRFIPQGSVSTVKRPKNVRQLLQALGIMEETALVIRDGRLLTEDLPIHPGQTIDIQRVVSAG